jgi:hypothetical protein
MTPRQFAIRSPMPPRKTGLKATTIRASGKRMKSSRPKITPARANARGQDCTLRLPGCTNQTVTVVLCHLRMFGGGGTGIKPHDSEAVFACDHCHSILDGRRTLIPELRIALSYEAIAYALIRTLRAQREAGVLIFKGEK